MPAILDALRGRMIQREANALDTLAAGARAAARGEAYDARAIEQALVETRQTVADFEAAVEVARQRTAWLSAFDKLASATAKVGKLEGAAATEKARFEAARQAFIEKAGAIDADLAAARSTQDKGRQARDRLLDPGGVPGSIGEKYRAAVAEAEAANQTLADAERSLSEVVERVKSEERWIKQLTGEAETELRGDRIFVTKPAPSEDSRRIEEHRAALARALRRKADAEAQLTEAERAAARAARAVEALVPEVLKA